MDTNHTIRFTWVVLFIAIGVIGMKGDEIGNGTANSQSNTTSLALQGNEDTGGGGGGGGRWRWWGGERRGGESEGGEVEEVVVVDGDGDGDGGVEVEGVVGINGVVEDNQNMVKEREEEE
uniref:Glycine-rich protein n=1 Tax=Quercus lobata TaxID=97700 RepID=A0A7N2KT32_QUELO